MLRELSKKSFLFAIGIVALIFVAIGLTTISDKPVDFSADVKPILNKKCISCHGGVKAKAGFSVLFREEALAPTESGKPAIIPGKPEESEMIRRLTLEDTEERMPYKHEALSEEEIGILTRWVRQGAKWGDHWAYVPVKEIPVPDIEDSWIKNGVDGFILEKLREMKMDPSGESDRATLLRRVSLDLIGMYPSDKIAAEYLNSRSEKAYEILVDSLLASQHFGEKWTSMWLDLARYADTKGYDQDFKRDIWQYRDWVIKSFNEDKPYDRFITEQIAGDLLPDPSYADYIATAFHRNTMTNDEGGSDNEEFRVAAVMDRVNTTWEALMSTSFSCVQCHSHPYDPFRHEEYYTFLAYFNNTRDEDTFIEYPFLKQFPVDLDKQLEDVVGWVKRNSSAAHAGTIRQFLLTGQPAINSTKAIPIKNAVLENNNNDLTIRNNAVFKLTGLKLDGFNKWVFRYLSKNPGGVLSMRLDDPRNPVIATARLEASEHYRFAYIDFPAEAGMHDVYFTYENPAMPAVSEKTLARFGWFAFLQFPSVQSLGYSKYFGTFRQLLEANTPTTPVMVENPPFLQRETFVFDRGNMRTPGDMVEPGVPVSLNMALPENAPSNRTGLALWLTSKKNPLVSRTMVNRLWEQLFGAGIVETLEDMGTQGSLPTHRELLDFLSHKFMYDYAWSIKRLLKEMVMSATYRQDSRLTDDMKDKDLFNKYYARGPRTRLSAEQLRDQHLCISNTMSDKMYGPSVMPWQPEGVWNSPYNSDRWRNSEGEDSHRRAVYTFWKRASPYPSMITFDGADRVVCVARRIRTNTPLQALVTLNDSAYFDMARHFALRMKRAGGNDASKIIAAGYKWMLYKEIHRDALSVFVDLYQNALDEFVNDREAVREITGNQSGFNDPAAAALIVVANSMMNLDEVVTKN